MIFFALKLRLIVIRTYVILWTLCRSHQLHFGFFHAFNIYWIDYKNYTIGASKKKTNKRHTTNGYFFSFNSLANPDLQTLCMSAKVVEAFPVHQHPKQEIVHLLLCPMLLAPIMLHKKKPDQYIRCIIKYMNFIVIPFHNWIQLSSLCSNIDLI